MACLTLCNMRHQHSKKIVLIVYELLYYYFKEQINNKLSIFILVLMENEYKYQYFSMVGY